MRRVLALALVLLAAAPAHANDTSMMDGRYGPEPVGGGLTGPESVIRMAREHLAITFGRTHADVVATFTFVNTLKDQTAHQLVGFPDDGAALKEAQRRGNTRTFSEERSVQPLQSFQTFVDGKPLQHQLRYGYVRWADKGEGWVAGKPGDWLMAWYAVPVTFPPAKEVTVQRRYRATQGSNVLGMAIFDYITHTGGVWQGPIGRLVADVTFVDGITTKDLAWKGTKLKDGYVIDGKDRRTITSPDKPSWRFQDATHMQLVWTNFEPRTQADRDGFKIVAHVGPP